MSKLNNFVMGLKVVMIQVLRDVLSWVSSSFGAGLRAKPRIIFLNALDSRAKCCDLQHRTFPKMSLMRHKDSIHHGCNNLSNPTLNQIYSAF